jgi:hypothetical protein
LLEISVDRGSSAWFIGDPRTHDPAMDAPCKAPDACRDSIIENVHVVPTMHIMQIAVSEFREHVNRLAYTNIHSLTFFIHACDACDACDA